jgi:hypothetical protein
MRAMQLGVMIKRDLLSRMGGLENFLKILPIDPQI